MAINWQEILVTVGGGTGASFAIAWLLKSIINHGLTRDIETFKARLQADATKEAENLKHSLEKTAVEHQVRFANLHSRRAEVIAEIYTKMVDAEQKGQRFAYVEGYEDHPTRQEAYKETMTTIVDLYYFIEKRRIYLPEEVCALLKCFVDTVRKSIIGINIFAPLQPAAHNPQVFEQKVKMLEDVSEAFEKSIPAAREALEKEFRSILGAEK
jgi:hypothetical protein